LSGRYSGKGLIMFSRREKEEEEEVEESTTDGEHQHEGGKRELNA